MSKERLKIIIRYNNDPAPVIGAFLVSGKKGAYAINDGVSAKLEKFQVEDGYITDNKVLAEKIIKKLKLGDKNTFDGVIVLYDTPDLLRFNTILPRSGLGSAKKLAKKELNEFFRTNGDTYKQTNRIVYRKEGGIIFYVDLIPARLIDSLEQLLNQMNKYIESSVSFAQAAAGAFEPKDEQDTFIVYQDEVSCHILLLFQSKLIDSIVLYKADPEDNEIYSNIEILRSKHLFAFERRETDNILFIDADEERKARHKDFLCTEKGFNAVEAAIAPDDVITAAAKNADGYIDGFYIRI